MKRILILLVLMTSMNVGFSQDKLGFGNMPDGVDSAGFGTVTTWVKPSSEADSVYLCGEWYGIVKIGNQEWLNRHMRCDDGQGGITNIDNNYCDPYASENYDSTLTHGYLYTFRAAQRIDNAISGWHIPTQSEASLLIGVTNIYFNTIMDGYYDYSLIPPTYFQKCSSTYNWTSTEETQGYNYVISCDFGFEIFEGATFGVNEQSVSLRLIKD